MSNMESRKVALFFLIFWILFLGCFSCKRSTNSLRELESVIRTNPDSTLHLLDSIAPAYGSSQRMKSYYALLKTMNLDILHYHFTDDSLIQCAAKFFDNRGSIHHRMLTQYYKGTVAYHLTRYSDAIIFYEKAIALAEKENDMLYLGLAYRNISTIHLYNYEYNESQKYIIKSLHYFSAGNYLEHLESSRLHYAETFQQAGEVEKADSVYKIVIEHSQNYPLVYTAYKNLAYLHKIKTQTDAEYVLDLYKKGGEYGYSSTDLCKIAYAYSFLDRKTSKSLFKSAYLAANNTIDTARIENYRYLVEKNNKNYKEALSIYERVAAIQDSLISLQLQKSLTSSLNDIYRRDGEINQLKSKNTRLTAIIISGITFFISILLGGLLCQNRRRRLYLMDAIRETKRILQEREDDNLRLVKTMMLSKISTIDEAALIYEKMKGTRKEEDAYKELRARIYTLQKDNNLYSEIETALDTYHHGIISQVRQDFPEITEYTFQLLLLFFAHIPQSTIELLRKSSESSIKTAKYRLRKLFRESSSPRKKDYLYLLDS